MKNKLAENMLRFGTKNLTESQLENIQETELNEEAGVWADETKALNNMVATMNAKLAEIDAKQEKPIFGDKLKFSVKETSKSMDMNGVKFQIPVWNFSFGGYPLSDSGLHGDYILASKGGNKSGAFKSLWLQPFKWNADKIRVLVQKSRNAVPRSKASTALKVAEKISLDSYNKWLAQREGAGNIQLGQ